MSPFDQTPWEMARSSPRIARARRALSAAVGQIADPSLRRAVRAMLVAARGREPVKALAAAPIQALADCTPGKLAARLPYDPTWAAPAAGPASHHCYPGGWAIHTALNTRAALFLARQAEADKGVAVDKDSLIAAHLLHDWAKLKLLVWAGDHTLDDDQGAGHHPLALAECMLRGLPPSVVRLMAGVHSGWWQEPGAVRRHLAQAAQLAGIDLEASPYGAAEEDPEILLIEGWIARQAEASWYTATKTAYQAMRAEVDAWHNARGIDVPLSRVRHLLFVTYDEFELAGRLARDGRRGLYAFLDAWFRQTAS